MYSDPWLDTQHAPALAYSAEEAAAMDRWLIDERSFSLEQLMEQAGARLAEAVHELAAAHGLDRVVLLVGPGHNGGDALVAGRLLGRAYAQETWTPLTERRTPVLDGRTLLLDGLFGVGLARPIGGEVARAVLHVNTSPAHVLAVDIPSGLCATTGEVLGATPDAPDGGVAIVAHHTLSFVGPKQGFFVRSGPAHVGRWRAAAIGFPPAEADDWLRRRRRGEHSP